MADGRDITSEVKRIIKDQLDVDHWPRLREHLTRAFARRTQDEWVAVFADSDACVAPVLSLRQAPHHPHLAERQTFVEHHGVVQPAPAPRFSATPTALSRPPARPGAHSREILTDWGIDHPDALLAAGVARQSTPAEPEETR